MDSLISLLDTPRTSEVVLTRKLSKARSELTRVQGIYESLEDLPSTFALDVRDEGMQVIDNLKKEATSVIDGLTKTIADLKKGKPGEEVATQTSPIIPMLERVVDNMEIVVEEISKKRKRLNEEAGPSAKRRNVSRTNENAIQLGEGDLNPNVNFGPMTLPVQPSFTPSKRRRSSNGKSGPPKKKSLLQQALSIASSSRKSSSVSSASGSVFSPQSSIVSGSSESSGGFDRRALDLN